jgi:hypothetical protein
MTVRSLLMGRPSTGDADISIRLRWGHFYAALIHGGGPLDHGFAAVLGFANMASCYFVLPGTIILVELRSPAGSSFA